jgi:polysaccharide pyruvyl transferase WcaK-like protein
VLVYGVNDVNKGSQLLLAAAAERLRYMGCTPVVDCRNVRGRSRRRFRAEPLLAIERLGRARSVGLDLLPRPLQDRLPVRGDSSFAAVVDASGYSLTDAWGMQPVTSRLSRLRRWTARGIRFVMLPQAFGPFTSEPLERGVAEILSHAAGVWARDEESKAYVHEVAPDVEVRVAPDVTITLDVPGDATLAGAVVLVPNWNLTRSGRGDRYVEALSRVVRVLRDDGHRVVGLCHEGERDRALLDDVASRVGGLEIIVPTDGIEAKMLIRGSELVISARYHALVSALSSAVPVIGHSWSHKYAALMSDFGAEEALADPMDADATLDRVRGRDRDAERHRLLGELPRVRARVDEMWAETAQLLSSSISVRS